jgi:hypothetical protein
MLQPYAGVKPQSLATVQGFTFTSYGRRMYRSRRYRKLRGFDASLQYMVGGINDLTATSIEKAVTGLMTMLELAATAVEEIVLFVTHMMKSTYLCLIKLAVHGSMKAVTTFDSAASSSLQNTIFALRDSLTDTSKTLSESIDTVKDKINHVPGMRNLSLPTIDFTNQIKRFKSINTCI